MVFRRTDHIDQVVPSHGRMRFVAGWANIGLLEVATSKGWIVAREDRKCANGA